MKIQRAVIRKPFDVGLETAEIPDSPGPGEVLIQTEASYISAGTELSGYAGLNPGRPLPGPPDYPLYPGYCNAGRVLKAGDGVEGFAEGERVYSFNRHASHHVVKPLGSAEILVHIPDAIPSQVAAPAWMAGIAATALQASSVSLHDTVAVFGLGIVGNLAAQLFQLSGARVIGVDPVAARRELARAVGIGRVAGGSPADVEGAVRDFCGEEGATITVEAVGHSAVAEQAAALTAPHGELILLGTQRAEYQTDLTGMMRHVHWKWIDIKGAQVWRIPMQPVRGVKHSIYGNAHMVLDLIASGRLKVGELISHRMQPARIKAAYDALLNDKENYWGVVLDWTA